MITENIRELETKARVVLTEIGYAKYTIEPIITVARTLTRLHDEQGAEQLNGEIVDNFVKHNETRYQNGEIIKTPFKKLKCVSATI